MDRMATHKRTQRHAATEAAPPRKDRLLWAVAVIAVFALYDIWGAWAQVGDKSGFAHGTGWTLTVIVEVYGVCALCAWLSPAGPRSRQFAMWSALVMFVLSLIGQASSRLTARSQVPPAAVVVFVSALPAIVLALIAVLVHLRHLDRTETAAAEQAARAAEQARAEAAAAADERTALRAELEAARAALEPLQADLETARNELARVTAKADQFARKLAAASGAKRTAKSPANKAASSPRNKVPGSPPGTEVPVDVDTQAEALLILAAEPGISGSDLGLRLGKTKRYGQILKNKLAGSMAGPDGGS